MGRLWEKLFILFVVMISAPQLLYAGMVDDTCAACHVMHASQVGLGFGTYTPRQALLKNGCEGCHTEVDGSSIGPAVLDKTGTDLAGGDFASAVADPRKGHNPNEISTADTLTSPPGWVDTFGDSAGNQVADGGVWAADKLSCAGKFGCHGNHSIDNNVLSMEKAHHNNTGTSVSPPDGATATVGGSYRFLHGIKGYEDDDWQGTVGAGDHNVYFDEARSGVETSGDRVASKQTISYLCAQCHGKFHSGVGSEGILATGTMFTDPWIRHPVGVEMPNAGDYTGYTTFNDDAPVASSSVKLPGDHDTDIGTPTNRILMCLSCHRAHASPYYASMRWDYRDTPGTSVNGCSDCHSSKQ